MNRFQRHAPVFALLFPACLNVLGCGPDSDTTTTQADTPALIPGSEDLFAFVSNVTTPELTSTFIALTGDVPSEALDLSNALELTGFGDAFAFDGKVFTTNGETFEVTRYRVEAQALVAEATFSLQGRGLSFLGDLHFLDAEHAYAVNGDQYTLIEWNPTLMTVTTEHDLGMLRREGWGSEYRGGFMRVADGKLFLYWAYTNDRVEFINDFILGVFDPSTRALSVLEQPECPATAGFGGFFDEQGDLYLIADSFGGFTFFGNAEPKPACVLRVKSGEAVIDSSFQFLPTDALGGGLSPWGLYYAGNGIAYTTAVNPAQLPNYASVFEFIFAPVHEGWTLDIRNATATKIEAMPADAVGFESVTLDGQLLVPRSTAQADIYDVNDVQTTVYGLSGSRGEANRLFTMPGYLGNAIRLR